MTPECYKRVVELFHQASERSPDTLLTFLTQVCAGDDELRGEVEAMLAADEQAIEFLEKSPDDLAAAVLAAHQVPLLTGQRLGDYEVLARLGEGGMGEVYLAEDTRLGRKAALKLLPEAFATDQVWLRRFKREARALSALNHPNVITIYGVGQVGLIHFLATELVEGRTLREEMAIGPMDWRVALEIAAQAASALSAAHAAGIVHRDIKPENMILRPDGLVKVLDFGLAKRTGKESLSGGVPPAQDLTTQLGIVVGTVRYMSPEQVRGAQVDARTDLFSLGVVLYEMIAGRPPFVGETNGDLIAEILKAEPLTLRQKAPDKPAELERILWKTLRKDKEERYQAANDLVVDLKNLKQHLDFQVERERSDARQGVEPAQSSRYRMHLRRVLLGLMLLVALALVVPLGFMAWRSAHKPLSAPAERASSPSRLLSGATSEGGTLLSRQINFIPGNLLVTPDGGRLYAIEDIGKAVLVLSAADLTLEASLTLPSGANRMVMSPDGKRIYAGSSVDGIMVIDTGTNRAEDLGIRTGGPVVDLDVSKDGRKMYLAMGSKGLKEVDLRKGEARSISDDISPQFVKIDPTGRQLYVSYQGGGPGGSAGHDALVVYDLGDNYKPRLLPRLPRVGGAIMFVPSSNRVLLDEWDACSNLSYDREGCPAEPSRVFHILSTTDFNVVKTLTLPVSVGGGIAYADGRSLAFGGESIVIYDIVRQKTLERLSRIGENYGPISFAPQSDRVFVALNSRPEILMFRRSISKCSGPETGLTNLYSGDGTLDDIRGTGSAKLQGTVDFGQGVIGQAFHFGSDKKAFLEWIMSMPA